MIDSKIEDQLHVALLAKSDELLQILFRSEAPVDLIVVLGVVFMIGRRTKDRRKPNSLNTKALTGTNIPVIQIIHAIDDSAKITNTVSAGIGKRANEYLIKRSVIILNRVGCWLRRGTTTQTNGKNAKKECPRQQKSNFCDQHMFLFRHIVFTFHSLTELRRASSILPHAFGPPHFTKMPTVIVSPSVYAISAISAVCHSL